MTLFRSWTCRRSRLLPSSTTARSRVSSRRSTTCARCPGSISRRFRNGRTALASLVHETGTRHARLLIGGQWTDGEGSTPVLDKFLGTAIGDAALGGREQVDQAVAAAKRSFETVPLEPYERYRILLRTAEL